MEDLTGVQYCWNLREMYPDDGQWKEEMEQAVSVAKSLAARKGSAAKDAKALLETARQYESLHKSLSRLSVFAHSNFDQDMSDTAAKELYELASNRYTVIGEALSFLAPELMAYSMEDFLRYAEEEPELKLYEHFARDFFERKAHVLSVEMEGLMVRMNDLGGSFHKIFNDLTVNDMEFPEVTTPEGETYKADESHYHRALSHPDQSFRKAYYEGLLGTYRKHINTLSSVYYGSVKDDVYSAKSRNYASAREQSLAANHIPETVYDNLISTARANTKPLQEYVALRKEKLGLEEFYFSDFFVPLVEETDRRYSFAEACDLVKKAVAPLGEDYVRVLERAMSERWIDVAPRENKISGAYCTSAYGHHPYVLLNFTGTLDGVFTLAHELGHAMHSYYSSQSQPFIYAGYSIFCAEVASTLNEQLLSEYLYNHTDSPQEKKLLLSKRLDDIRSTFYRQTMFADFEYQTHRWVEEGNPLLPDKLCRLHRELNELYYGSALKADDILSCEWARIPHFYRAFYMYQYATGISASISIARRILSEGAPAVADYRRFLTTGGSDHPIELLRIAGVDMATPKPVLDTISAFAATLEELKTLL